MITICTSTKPAAHGRRAFTFVELLAVLGVLAVLASVMVTGFARTQPPSKSIQCLSNTRRLIAAWQMYAQDNNDKLVVVAHGGAAMGGAGDPTWGVGWASGWLDWTAAPDNTNLLYLLSASYAKLGPYLSDAANVCNCPANTYLSPAQKQLGWQQRARSYSVNLTVGAGNARTGPLDALYQQALRITDLVNPGPSDTSVFVEEHPDSINDPGIFPPAMTFWYDLPATYHYGAAAFSFADGHAEMHRWQTSLTAARARGVLYSFDGLLITAPKGDADIHWMSSHSQRVSSRSY